MNQPSKEVGSAKKVMLCLREKPRKIEAFSNRQPYFFSTTDYNLELGNQISRIAKENQLEENMVLLVKHMTTSEGKQSYDELRNNPGVFLGKAILLEGIVDETSTNQNLTTFVVNRSGSTVQPFAIAIGQSHKAKRGDKIAILGYCAGTFVVYGATVPAVAARVITTPFEMLAAYKDVEKMISSQQK